MTYNVIRGYVFWKYFESQTSEHLESKLMYAKCSQYPTSYASIIHFETLTPTVKKMTIQGHKNVPIFDDAANGYLRNNKL